MQLTPMYRSSRTVVALMALASTLPVITTRANAGEGGGGYGYSSLAQREIIRRQNDVADADRLIAEGREAYARGDFQQAVDKYSQALDRLPNSPAFDDRRASYTGHLADASVALSMQHRRVGKYAEARTLLERVLSVDPQNALAKKELGFLDDPIRTNPALTYEHTQNGSQAGLRRRAAHRPLQLRRPPRHGAHRSRQVGLLSCRLRPHPRRTPLPGGRRMGTLRSRGSA
ncbi:MAG: tetratricopeptide repeat protein [Akkermansiaceae bacterium]|nr:tetratricopeptide repeat protein [Akkermansiaceae bacterium]